MQARDLIETRTDGAAHYLKRNHAPFAAPDVKIKSTKRLRPGTTSAAAARRINISARALAFNFKQDSFEKPIIHF